MRQNNKQTTSAPSLTVIKLVLRCGSAAQTNQNTKAYIHVMINKTVLVVSTLLSRHKNLRDKNKRPLSDT